MREAKIVVVRSRVKVEAQVDVTSSLDDLLPFVHRYHKAKATAFCNLKSNSMPHSSNPNLNICAQGAMPCRKNEHLLAHHFQLRAHPGRIRTPNAALIFAGQTDSDLNTQRSKSHISYHHNGAHVLDKPLGASERNSWALQRTRAQFNHTLQMALEMIMDGSSLTALAFVRFPATEIHAWGN